MAARALLPRLQDFEVYYNIIHHPNCSWLFVVELFVWFYYLALSISITIILLYFSHMIRIGIHSFYPFIYFGPISYYFKQQKKKKKNLQTKSPFFILLLFPVFVCGLSSFFDDVSFSSLSDTYTHTHGSQNAKPHTFFF